jgi:anti-sigma B factor antagonist
MENQQFDMTYSHSLQNNISIFELEGSLLGDNEREALVNDFINYLNQDVKYFLMDLSKLKHINSTGLGIFITLYTKVRGKGGEMVICNPNVTISNLLAITKLNSVFNIAENRETAINKLVAAH